MTDQTKTSTNVTELTSVEDHVKYLQSAVTPQGLLAWILKLTTLSEQEPFSHFPVFNLQDIKVSIIKSLNASDNDDVDADATYIQPYLLGKLSSKLRVNPIHTVIKNNWQKHNYYNLLIENGFDSEISASTYTGETDKLRQVVADMLNAWNNRNHTFQLSLVLPSEQDFWDVFNFDEKVTSEYLQSSYGKVSILSIMQLLGMTESFIDAALSTMFPESSDNESPVISFSELKNDPELKGYCLTPKVQEDIQCLMTIEDKNNTNAATPVIPRVNANKGVKFNVISGMKYNYKTGLTATENDLASIRETMIFNMSCTGGVIITFNIPVANDGSKDRRCTTPTMIVPKAWSDSIKSNRPQNNKQDEVDTLPEELANETTRQKANRARKTKRILQKQFERDLLDQTIDKSDKAIQRCYPAPITNR